MRAAFAPFLAAAVLGSFLPAGRTAAESGESAGITLLQPLSARPAAMAEAYSAVLGAADCLGYNPAGLAGVGSPILSGLYHGGFAADTFVSVLYGRPAGPVGTAFSLAYYTSGSVERLDPAGGVGSVIGQRDILLSAGAGGEVPGTGLTAGLALKFLRTQMIEEISGSALAGDLGVGYDVPGLGLRLGAAAANLGGKIKLGDSREDVPQVYRAGLAYTVVLADSLGLAALGGASPETPADRMILAAQASSRSSDGILEVAAGMEYLAAGSLALRGGWRNSVSGSRDRSAVVCLGVGADVGGVTVDYAVEVTRYVAMHRMGVSLKL